MDCFASLAKTGRKDKTSGLLRHFVHSKDEGHVLDCFVITFTLKTAVCFLLPYCLERNSRQRRDTNIRICLRRIFSIQVFQSKLSIREKFYSFALFFYAKGMI